MRKRETKAYKFITSLLHDPKDVDIINKSGVYKIYHISNPNDFYIGSTAYKRKDSGSMCGFYGRWTTHLASFRYHKALNRNLQRLADEKGIDGFRFAILRVCNNRAECRHWEQLFIEQLNPTLNIFKNVIGPLREIYQFDYQGNFIKRFDAVCHAAAELGLDRSGVTHAALGTAVSAGGFLFSYTMTPRIPKARIIEQRTLDGNLVRTFGSLSEVMEILKLPSSTAIRNCFIGKQKQAYGYRWMDKKIDGYIVRDRHRKAIEKRKMENNVTPPPL